MLNNAVADLRPTDGCDLNREPKPRRRRGVQPTPRPRRSRWLAAALAPRAGSALAEVLGNYTAVFAVLAGIGAGAVLLAAVESAPAPDDRH